MNIAAVSIVEWKHSDLWGKLLYSGSLTHHDSGYNRLKKKRKNNFK